MKNIFFNWNKTVRNKVLLFSFFLFTSQITLASVDPTSFTVTGTNGTCLSNASIKVTVPAGDYNSGWTAYISKTGYSSEQVVPVIGGDIVFNSLAPGNYNVELKETFRALPTQQVTLTTNYVDFTLGNTYKLPSASCPGATDGELTVKVLSGGAGPFKYDVSYPTPAPGTGTTNQTYTGPERNHTFLNVPGGIVVNYTVTDFVGGASGCENSKTQNPTLGNVSVSTVDFYGLSPFNFVRTSNTKCNNPTLYVNLNDNVTAARDAVISAAGNAVVVIKDASGAAKGTWPLTRQYNKRYKYDAAAVGGPELENNWTVTVKINWGCAILERTSTVAVGNNWVNHNIKYSINSSCTVDYVWYLLGENQTPEGNRNMYFLADNKLRFEKWNGSAWVAVPSTDVTPDPATMYNPLGVTGAYTGTLPSANGQFIFKTPGSYRYFASDDCHIVSSTFNFVTKTNPINEVSVVQSKSVLQGTSGIKITIGTPLKPNFTMKISRADGKTSIPFTATGPLNMAGSYTATFPKNATITSTSSVGGYWDFSDLPLGDYIVELSDGCGSIRTVNITLNQPAEYTSTFTPVLSCTGSNKITYNLGQNANAYVVGTATLYTDNGSGAPGAYQANLSGTSGTFINLNAGDYVVAFNGVGAGLSSVSGVTYLKSYYQKVKIAPYGGIEIETSSVMCDPTDNTSGIVNVELVNNDILTPTTIKLFSASDMTTPIRNIVLAAGETGTVFQNIAVGNYVVRVTNECTSIDKNISITTGSTGTAPIAKVNRPKVCNSDKTIKLAITASNRLYDVVWTNSSNTVVGNTTPLELTDPINTTYTATFKLKSSFGCANVQEYTSSVDVVVTADPDLTSAVVSDIDLCLNTSRDFTISNTQAGFKYELTDKDGISYATPIYSAESTGGTITMTIPAGITLVAGNTFKIKAISGGCSGFLTDVVSITSKQNNLNLDVITPTAMICSGTDSTLTIKNTESGVTYTVKKNGVTIPFGTVTGTGLDINFNIPATFLTAGTNEFIVSTSGTGCQNGDLAQRGIINVNTAPVISGALTTIELFGCDSITVPSPYTTIAQLESNGVTISDDATIDADLIISSTDAANPGSAIKKFFTRTYKITDACGVFKTVNQTIILNITTPTAPTISAATATTFCIGGSVVLTSSVTTGNQWYKDGALITGATSSTYTATVAGTYTVTTTNTIPCSSPASAGVVVVVNALPLATINDGVTLAFVDCSATTIDLTASVGSSYVWYRKLVNETAFSVLPDVTIDITATNLGFYKVKVIDSSTNCEAESQVTQVVAKPAVSPTVLQPCVGNTVTLESNTTSFDTPTFQWKKDGIDIAGATTHNWDVTEDGEYTVEVTDGRTVGNIGTQTSCGVEVHFNPLPVVEAGTNFTITCTSNPTGLTIGETPEAGFDYVWTSPKGISGLTNATIANPVANPTETTTYTVRKTNHLTLCWKEDTITITVDKTAPTANAGSNFTRTCVANTLGKEIGIAPISGQTYSWSPATGLDNAFIANPNANPETTQTYTLTVENTTNGCTAQATVVASVDVSAPTANAGTAFTKTCVTNPTGQLIGAPAVSGETYSWFPTTGLSDASIANPNANPTATTTYKVTARKTTTGCTATNSVIVTVLDTPNPVALSTTIANNCPLETVDLATIQPAAVSGIVYEWWTGTATTRTTQITNPTLYATAGTIYLWSKTASEGCYNAVPSAVNVTMNVCCESTIGVIQETNPFYLVNYAPADITTLEHINYATSSVVRYAIVNDLDGKIKQINTTKPEFTQLPAGNYTVHAFVFGPTVVPTGLVVGNKLAQVVPFCGTTATKTLRVQSICSSAMSYTETLTNAKQYALLDTTTDQFVQVNTTGTFTMIHTGMPHQVIGFNYTGTAIGIQVGGTIAGVTATNLDMTAGAIVSGCTAIITQIDGNIYNDKDKRCIEGLNNQTGLPLVTLYAKLLDSSNQVIAVSSAIQYPNYTFSMTPDLLDGVYSIVLDDNDSVTDAVATYPNSWKGNTQTFTIASGQIVEYLSNTANFVPMCMQAATNKPILKPTANLVGNTYNFCKGVAATSLIIDALPGATVNWYTTAVGGVAKSTPFIPTTSVVGTTTCYVSQTLNGAESDRTEVIIDVHDLPEQPTAISGSNFIAANTTQLYGVVNSTNAVTYNWILPTDWTGTSTSKDITVQVGTKDGTIGVTATSAFGCISPIQELVVRVVLEDDIEVYNSLSPNGDGDNDIFRIRNIDFYPENTLSIFNRWGIEVYHVNSYGQNDNFFKGFSDGRSTTSRDVELPEGSYFYTLTYKNTKGIERNLSGYLYIKQ